MTTQPPEAERLHHLLDRLLHGVILPEEAEQLAALVRAREDRLALLETGARERSALLEEARDALENAGINEAHGGESWPRLVPAIEELAADRAGWKARFERVQDRVGELEADNHRYEEVVVGDLNEANIGLQREVARLTAVPDRTTLPELHQRIVDSVTTAWPDLRFVADDLGHLVLAARDQHIEQLERRIAELTAGTP